MATRTDPLTDAQLRKLTVQARRWLLWAGQWLDPRRGPIDLERALMVARQAEADAQTVVEELLLRLGRGRWD